MIQSSFQGPPFTSLENDNVVILSPGGRAGSTALLQLLQTRPEFKVIREALRRARSLQALKTTLDNAFAGAIGQRVVLSIKFEQHVPSGMSLVQLLELLRDKYGFRHYILLQRSPVRTAISMRAGEKFGWMKRVTGRCDRHKYRLASSEVLKRTCDQQLAWNQIHNISGVRMIGFNYERDLSSGVHRAYPDVCVFLGLAS